MTSPGIPVNSLSREALRGGPCVNRRGRKAFGWGAALKVVAFLLRLPYPGHSSSQVMTEECKGAAELQTRQNREIAEVRNTRGWGAREALVKLD